MPLCSYNLEQEAFVILSVDVDRNLQSINLFAPNERTRNYYRTKIDDPYNADVVQGFGSKYLISNTIPDDHREIHDEAGAKLGVNGRTTEGATNHWHWSTKAEAQNRTGVEMVIHYLIVQKFLLGKDALPFFKLIRL